VYFQVEKLGLEEVPTEKYADAKNFKHAGIWRHNTPYVTYYNLRPNHCDYCCHSRETLRYWRATWPPSRHEGYIPAISTQTCSKHKPATSAESTIGKMSRSHMTILCVLRPSKFWFTRMSLYNFIIPFSIKLQNVNIFQNCTFLQPRRHTFSQFRYRTWSSDIFIVDSHTRPTGV
jgi:hypothetical protein